MSHNGQLGSTFALNVDHLRQPTILKRLFAIFSKHLKQMPYFIDLQQLNFNFFMWNVVVENYNELSLFFISFFSLT